MKKLFLVFLFLSFTAQESLGGKRSRPRVEKKIKSKRRLSKKCYESFTHHSSEAVYALNTDHSDVSKSRTLKELNKRARQGHPLAIDALVNHYIKIGKEQRAQDLRIKFAKQGNFDSGQYLGQGLLEGQFEDQESRKKVLGALIS